MTDKLTVLGNNKLSTDVAAFFKTNADVGSDNLSGSIPQLKVTEALSTNQGVDGQNLPEGCFYYTPTREDFKTREVNIITISRGFYAMSNDKIPKPKFNQLVGGVLSDTNQPFVMFFGGTRLENLWKFGKEVNPFTKNKERPIPMFAFRVEIGLEKIKTDGGSNHVVTFKLIRNEKNQIQIATDIGKLTFLKDSAASLEEMFSSFISQKEVDKVTGEPMADKPQPIETNQEEDDIPFG